jgi:hypothetical protein
MAHQIRWLRIAVAGLVAAMVSGVVVGPVGADTSTPASPIGTPLPPGWELCILQGVSAPVTGQNVADLDEWQLAEGGSTNNTAAYNPYNTYRLTDVNNAPLPGTPSANGFPAFTTWAAGCAATVATLLQANMAPIVTALRAGNVSPPGAFLATVDRSQWCAADNGIPCYASEIAASTNSLDLTALVASSSAVGLFGAVGKDLDAYVTDVATTNADQSSLQAATQALIVVQGDVVGAQKTMDGATRALRHLALDEYTGNSSLSPDNALTLFEPSSNSALLAKQYDNIAATRLIATYKQAQADLQVALAKRASAAAALAQASSAVLAAQTTQDQGLVKLAADQAALQAAGACTAGPQVAPTLTLTAGPAAASGAAPTPSPSSGTAAPTPAPSGGAPTASANATPSPTGSNTGTSTTSTTTTTTTTTAPGAPTTTTTTVAAPPPQSAVPVPAPDTPASTTQPASPTGNPAGVSALQGCVASLTPPAPATPAPATPTAQTSPPASTPPKS